MPFRTGSSKYITNGGARCGTVLWTQRLKKSGDLSRLRLCIRRAWQGRPALTEFACQKLAASPAGVSFVIRYHPTRGADRFSSGI